MAGQVENSVGQKQATVRAEAIEKANRDEDDAFGDETEWYKEWLRLYAIRDDGDRGYMLRVSIEENLAWRRLAGCGHEAAYSPHPCRKCGQMVVLEVRGTEARWSLVADSGNTPKLVAKKEEAPPKQDTKCICSWKPVNMECPRHGYPLPTPAGYVGNTSKTVAKKEQPPPKRGQEGET